MGSAPDAPDPAETSNAQFNYNTGASIASGIINNPNIRGPGGNTTYKQAGKETIKLPNGQTVQIPRYTQTQSLSKAGQRQYDSRNALISQLMGQNKKYMDIDPRTGAPKMQSGYGVAPVDSNFRTNAGTSSFYGQGIDPNQQSYAGKPGTSAYATNMNLNQYTGKPSTQAYGTKMNLDTFGGNLALNKFNPSMNAEDLKTSYAPKGGFSEDRRRVEEAMMSRGEDLLSKNRESEVARLAAMGLAPGGEKYGRVSDQFERSGNDLAMQSILAGGEEQSRLLGEARSAGEFRNQAVGQGYGMQMGTTAAENERLATQMGFNRDTMEQNNSVKALMANFGFSKQQAENARRMGEATFGRETTAQNNETKRLMSEFGFSKEQAENARKMNEATFGRQTVAQNNQARQAEATMRSAKIQMENARRSGDMEAYNRAKEAHNNAQITKTSMNKDKASFNNQTRQAMIAEMLGLQGGKMNQLLSMMTGQQTSQPNAPGYQGYGVQAPNYQQMVSDNYGQKVGQYNNMISGISSLAGIGLKPFMGSMFPGAPTG